MSNIAKNIKKNPLLALLYARLFFIRKTARFRRGYFTIFNKRFIFVDSASFVAMYIDIFIDEAYRFKAKSSRPLILDCGANIGLSMLYFKTLYPDAMIEAFEPDRKIFDVLEDNRRAFGLNDVTLVNKGVWIDDHGISFSPDGADGGRIDSHHSGKDSCEIPTVRLKDILEKKGDIDLLKIDIEGAEVEVLRDCRDRLSRVDMLFVEYHSSSNDAQTLDELLTILKDAGFRYYINSIGGSSKNYFLYHEGCNGFDLQLNIYARRT